MTVGEILDALEDFDRGASIGAVTDLIDHHCIVDIRESEDDGADLQLVLEPFVHQVDEDEEDF